MSDAPATIHVAWRPGWHARIPERIAVPLGLVAEARRAALADLLRSTSSRTILDSAFTPPVRQGRWTDGSVGAFYVAEDPVTAMHEKLHHDAAYFRTYQFGPRRHVLELHHVDVTGTFDDVRPVMATDSLLADTSDYTRAQSFGVARHTTGSAGLLYASVRDPGHACLVVFDRRTITRIAVHRSVAVEWDGTQFLFEGVDPA